MAADSTNEHEDTPVKGLLDTIADTALDDDYYVVRSGPYEQSREFNTVLTAVVLAVFALMVTIAAMQTRDDRPATERERETLIEDIAARKDRVAAREERAAELQGEVSDLSASVVRYDPDYERLRVQASDAAARGSGVVVTVSPGSADITDFDLQQLVNGLWYAGAEAISINGNRLATLSSIGSAESAIRVNFKPVAPPYTVIALGDAETLPQRFEENPAGRYWESRRKDAGVLFSIDTGSDLRVDAAPDQRVEVKHASVIEEDS